MIALEKRPQPSRGWVIGTPILAVVLTMIFGGILFSLLGKNPIETIRTIFLDPLFSEFAFYYRPQLLVIIGAICGAGVGLAFYPADTRLIFPLMVAAGALGGFAWAMIPGVLRVKFGTNEILVSLMLVYVAEQLLASMALGLLRNPDGMGFPGSRNLGQWPAAANGELIAGTGMHWGVVAAFIAVIFAYITLSRHIFGFQVRLSGPQSSSRFWGGYTPSASFWQAASWPSPISAEKSHNPTSAYRGRRSNCCKGCCYSSSSRST